MDVSMPSPTASTTPTFPAPSAPAPSIDFAAIKAKQQATWRSGDYAVIGTRLQLVGETLCEAVDLRSGERVLDVATGNGNAALAAARRFGDVTGIDYVPELLARARARAAADGLEIAFREADAEALPFEAASFDVVLSTFGVMFTPDQPRAASELARVTRPGGRIGLASWTPDGFIGALFKTLGRHVPPAPGLKSPSRWGTQDALLELFGGAAADLRTEPRTFTFRYLSAEHWLEVFRTWYGPLHRAFAALEAPAQKALADDVLALIRAHAHPSSGAGRGLVLPATYLEAVVTVR
jgi:ubiquinone/menaquinone biosynthesis C-methylase UbiE